MNSYVQHNHWLVVHTTALWIAVAVAVIAVIAAVIGLVWYGRS
jgi:hypothetical protein